ncbi:MAG TPA: NAD(P)-dependent oxidoreductase [Stellaceae bacterium]|nr:NAD(P)-dependent oxidoreductase [Stellaceae bacterium]
MSGAKPALGFVGLGNMGGPMTNNLVKAGYRVTGFDIDRPRLLQRAQEIGFHAAESLADCAKRSDTVITMLPNGHIVREAVLGGNGIAEGLAKGGLIIDLSSAGATGTAALGKELAASGIALIDAPVSGGVTGAVNGTLAIMVGGNDEAAIARAWPILETMGKKLFRAGPLGAGHAAKSINNYLGATNLIAIAEGLIAGTKFGLDPANLLAIVNASTGASGTSQGLYPGQVLNRKFGAGFALALMAKDVGLAADLARDVGINAEVMQHTAKVWARARDTLKGNPDFTEIVKMFEADFDTELVPRKA